MILKKNINNKKNNNYIINIAPQYPIETVNSKFHINHSFQCLRVRSYINRYHYQLYAVCKRLVENVGFCLKLSVIVLIQIEFGMYYN